MSSSMEMEDIRQSKPPAYSMALAMPDSASTSQQSASTSNNLQQQTLYEQQQSYASQQLYHPQQSEDHQPANRPQQMNSQPTYPIQPYQPQPTGQQYQQPIQIYVPPMVMEPSTDIKIAPTVGKHPTMINCPACRNTVVTKIDYESTARTHICATILFLVLLWPFIFVLYCTSTCRKTNHFCPSCGIYIGTYRN